MKQQTTRQRLTLQAADESKMPAKKQQKHGKKTTKPVKRKRRQAKSTCKTPRASSAKQKKTTDKTTKGTTQRKQPTAQQQPGKRRRRMRLTQVNGIFAHPSVGERCTGPSMVRGVVFANTQYKCHVCATHLPAKAMKLVHLQNQLRFLCPIHQ
jgi:hypothetical protein